MLLHISVNPLYRLSGLASRANPGVTPGLAVIDPNVGTTTQALGHLSADDWLHGRVPWWNPYAGVGLPLAAEMQSESFFLPFVLVLHYSNGVIWLKIALQVLAGTATFLLLRQLELGWVAAFLGGVFYAFNGTFSWFGHGEIMPLAFLPLFLLGVERAVYSAREGRRGGWVVMAIALAYSIYAGFPETAFMDGLLVLLWAVVRLGCVPAASRKLFIGKVCLGGCAGLLLAAPIMLPFFEYLRHSAVEHNDFGSRGPIEGFNGGDPANELATNWGNIGGYFGITVTFLAILGLFSGGRERGLRLLLGLWTVLLVARSIMVPGTSALFRLIPGMNLIAIYRNSSGSFEMATAILAAFAIDAWQRGRGMAWRRVGVSSASTAVLVATGICYGAPLIERLALHIRRYPVWVWSSSSSALIFLVLAAGLCLAAPTRRRAALMGAMVIAEAVGLYVVPQMAGARGRMVLDTAPLAFLKSHLGWQRAYALGGIHPNYGSYYGVPFVDHESLPVSDTWMGYVHQQLDPDADAVTFSGDYPGPLARRAELLRRNLGGFEAAGVKYVVAPRGEYPLEERTTLPHAPGGNVPVYLNESQQISGTLPAPADPIAKLRTATILLGTDGGAANGLLKMRLCSGNDCGDGEANLSEAMDNGPLSISLNPPVAVNPAQPLRYTLTHSHSTHPIAIWMYPATKGGIATLADGKTAMMTPEVSLVTNDNGNALEPVFQSATEDIFRLPNPEPYFAAGDGGCKLEIRSHEVVRSSCPAAGKLVRRELYYPGWRAIVNGREEQVTASSIFQAVALPAGEATVEFRYVPTNLGLACIAGLAGVALVAAGWRKRLI
jgi:hypothetical protein